LFANLSLSQACAVAGCFPVANPVSVACGVGGSLTSAGACIADIVGDYYNQQAQQNGAPPINPTSCPYNPGAASCNPDGTPVTPQQAANACAVIVSGWVSNGTIPTAQQWNCKARCYDNTTNGSANCPNQPTAAPVNTTAPSGTSAN
jgi:hypothetical protein